VSRSHYIPAHILACRNHYADPRDATPMIFFTTSFWQPSGMYALVQSTSEGREYNKLLMCTYVDHIDHDPGDTRRAYLGSIYPHDHSLARSIIVTRWMTRSSILSPIVLHATFRCSRRPIWRASSGPSIELTQHRAPPITRPEVSRLCHHHHRHHLLVKPPN